jgi:hypothetical protein
MAGSETAVSFTNEFHASSSLKGTLKIWVDDSWYGLHCRHTEHVIPQRCLQEMPSLPLDVKVSWTNGSARSAVIFTIRSTAIKKPE